MDLFPFHCSAKLSIAVARLEAGLAEGELCLLLPLHLRLRLRDMDADLVAVCAITLEQFLSVTLSRVLAPGRLVPFQPCAMPLDNPGDSGHEPVQRDFKLNAPAEVVVPLQAVAQFDEEVRSEERRVG